jgi:DNA-binding transcriptional ArsR family regulator
MPRAATTTDVFNAVAEPKRRRVLGALADGERSVNDIVAALNWPQPQVSKHLGVLRQVGLVSVRHKGRQRFYRVNGARLKPIHDWVTMYEKFWQHQLERVKQRAEAMARAAASTKTTQRKE